MPYNFEKDFGEPMAKVIGTGEPPLAGAIDSGFFVIGRKGSDFIALTDAWKSRGYRFDELWIFGKPRKMPEIDLWHAITPTFVTMDETMIHEIPNTKDEPRAQNH